LLVLSGLVIWKSVQFPLLRELMGGYDMARRIHFYCMTAIVCFVAVHLLMVVLVPRSLLAMLLGRATFRSTDKESHHEHIYLAQGQRRSRRRGSSQSDQQAIAASIAQTVSARGLTLGGLGLLSGCSIDDSPTAEAALTRISHFNDRVQGWLFDSHALLPLTPTP
jgi:multisubunit Na+/H+ antiporter MnhG subunit